MLVDEAKITASLQHDNIARVYEFARTRTREYFIAMEYVDGKDVRTLLERRRAKQKPIPPEHVGLRSGWRSARALHAAHTQRDSRRPPAAHRAPRRVAVERALSLPRRGQAVRLRHRQGDADAGADQDRRHQGQGQVHVARAGDRAQARPPLATCSRSARCLYEMLTLSAPFPRTDGDGADLRGARRQQAPGQRARARRSRPSSRRSSTRPCRARARSATSPARSWPRRCSAFLRKFMPSYRRSHFGRFMRNVFATEIERELRMLEEYVIEGVRPTTSARTCWRATRTSSRPRSRSSPSRRRSRSSRRPMAWVTSPASRASRRCPRPSATRTSTARTR